MKNFAIVITVIATVLFLFSTYQLTNDPVVRSTKDGMILFNFFIWFTIPGILWLIVLATGKK